VGDGAAVFLPHGRLPSAGDVLVQAALAETLQLIARDGTAAMHSGRLGGRILEFLEVNGSGLTADDFWAQRAQWVEPLSIGYRGTEVFQLPPNGQGIALLEMLAMLDGVDLTAWGQGSAELVHQLVERAKLAFADRDAYVGDPLHVDVPLEYLLDPRRARERAAHVGSTAAPSRLTTVGRSVDGDTVYLCAADRDGMVVSLIQSLYAAFGSGVHVPGTGVTLHNRGYGFNLLAGHPNELAPGKRPMHTLMPGFATRSARPWLAFGTRGADGQPQTCMQVLNSLLDFDLDLQAAIEAPRWAYGAPGDRFPATALVVEDRFSQSVIGQLAERGHEVMIADRVDSVMGTVQAVLIDQSKGCYIGASDPRGDGLALGL
jgi:gamma-glutamyltranspeptidase/glutathione hydrolase